MRRTLPLRAVLVLLVALLLAGAATTPALASGGHHQRHTRSTVTATVPARAVPGRSVTVSVRDRPQVRGRLVTLWAKRYGGGAATVLARRHEPRGGSTRLSVRFSRAGTYAVRAVLSRRGRAVRVESRLHRVDVVAPRPAAPAPPPPSKPLAGGPPVVMAHAGGALEGHPQNTMAAYRHALDEGVTALETDVQSTKDGQLVLFHDSDLKRLTDVETVYPDRADDPLPTFTLAELGRLRVDAGGPPEPVATFADLLSLVRDHPASSVLAEIKLPAQSDAVAGEPDLAQQMVEAVHASGVAPGQVVYQSFSEQSLHQVAELDPTASLSPVLGRIPADLAAYAWADSLTVEYSQLTAAGVAAAHARGLPVNAWTIDDAATARRVAALGVDVILSNRPALVRDALG